MYQLDASIRLSFESKLVKNSIVVIEKDCLDDVNQCVRNEENVNINQVYRLACTQPI